MSVTGYEDFEGNTPDAVRRPVPGGARRDDRGDRPARDPAVARVLRVRPAMGPERVHARVRRPADRGGPGGRPVRPAAPVRDRARGVRDRVARLCPRARPGAAGGGARGPGRGSRRAHAHRARAPHRHVRYAAGAPARGRLVDGRGGRRRRLGLGAGRRARRDVRVAGGVPRQRPPVRSRSARRPARARRAAAPRRRAARRCRRGDRDRRPDAAGARAHPGRGRRADGLVGDRGTGRGHRRARPLRAHRAPRRRPDRAAVVPPAPGVRDRDRRVARPHRHHHARDAARDPLSAGRARPRGADDRPVVHPVQRGRDRRLPARAADPAPAAGDGGRPVRGRGGCDRADRALAGRASPPPSC